MQSTADIITATTKYAMLFPSPISYADFASFMNTQIENIAPINPITSESAKKARFEPDSG